MSAEQILKDNGLRLTQSRKDVIDVFLDSSRALSHADIGDKLKGSADRVTIYRTLSSFLDKGIIHKVLDDSEAAKYALCHAACSDHEHHDNHVHFKCTTCGNSECLNEVQIPVITVPPGYEVKEANLLVEGTCVNCSK